MSHPIHSLKVMSPTGLDFYNDDPRIKFLKSKLFYQNCLLVLAIFVELLSQALVPQLNDHWSCRILRGRPRGAYNPRTDLFLVMIRQNLFLTFSTLGNTLIPNMCAANIMLNPR